MKKQEIKEMVKAYDTILSLLKESDLDTLACIGVLETAKLTIHRNALTELRGE